MTELEQQQKEQIEKLTARLQKAAEVFKTQKADIERVQGERDEANEEIEKLKSKVKDFEERINANSNTEAEMMKQAEELTRLESRISEKDTTIAGLRADLNEADEAAAKSKEILQNAISVIVNGMKEVSSGIKQIGVINNKEE